MKTPSHFHLVYSRESINKRIEELGKEITPWLQEVYQKSGKDILAIPLLRGGIFFFSDLVRELPYSVALSPCRASAYHETGPSDVVKVTMEEDLIAGRAVLLIDEICDSGRTLDVLSKRCRDLGATEVKQAVLIKRVIKDAFEPTWVGFRYVGDEWLVGYGMDERERYRNLPGVYKIQNAS